MWWKARSAKMIAFVTCNKPIANLTIRAEYHSLGDVNVICFQEL